MVDVSATNLGRERYAYVLPGLVKDGVVAAENSKGSLVSRPGRPLGMVVKVGG